MHRPEHQKDGLQFAASCECTTETKLVSCVFLFVLTKEECRPYVLNWCYGILRIAVNHDTETELFGSAICFSVVTHVARQPVLGTLLSVWCSDFSWQIIVNLAGRWSQRKEPKMATLVERKPLLEFMPPLFLPNMSSGWLKVPLVSHSNQDGDEHRFCIRFWGWDSLCGDALFGDALCGQFRGQSAFRILEPMLELKDGEPCFHF